MTRTQVKQALQLKRQLKRQGIRYRQVSGLCGRSYSLVYHVLNGRKTSPAVMAAARTLLHNGGRS